jgi:DNA-binding transcriptional LysR family regulator
MRKKYNHYYKDNKLQQIKGFINIVIFDGITNAANHMGLTQSAISHQVGSLEEDLGLKLFTRIGNKMVLTEDGQRFYQYVMPIIKQIDSMYDIFIIKNDKDNQNQLKIVAYHSAINTILPRYIKHLLDKYQEIDLIIENSDRDNGLRKLRSGECDLIFFAIDKVPDDLVNVRTFSFNPTLIISKNNKLASKVEKLTIEDIVNENILLIDSYKILPIYNELFSKYNIRSVISFINSDWETLKQFIKQGIGVSFYADVNLKEDLDSGIVNINIAHLFPKVEYKLISRSISNSKLSIRKFLEIIDRFGANNII